MDRERLTIAAASPDLATFIRENFELTAPPSVPEICIHKAGPKSGLWRLAEADDAFGNPYWAYHWGGGLALARHVLDNLSTAAGRRILDLGAGSGIVGIAAAKSGAAYVLAADVDPYAVAATRLNADANGVTIETVLGDAMVAAPPDVEVVLAGDTFYNPDIAASTMAFLDRCLAKGIDVLVGDPGRDFLPRERLALIAEYPGGDFGSGAQEGPRLNAVFAFR